MINRLNLSGGFFCLERSGFFFFQKHFFSNFVKRIFWACPQVLSALENKVGGKILYIKI